MKEQIQQTGTYPRRKTVDILGKGSYMVCLGNRIVDSSRMGLANLNEDGSVSIKYYPDHLQATRRQLELRDYLVTKQVKCQDDGLEEAIEAVRVEHTLLTAMLQTMSGLTRNSARATT